MRGIPQSLVPGKVMVMVEDPAIKQARLQLLGKMVRLFKEVADLSEIQVASSK